MNKSRLKQYIDSCIGKPFEYGKHDCALFVANCIEVLTGDQIGCEFRFYRSKSEADAIIRKHGTLRDLWTSLMKKQPDNSCNIGVALVKVHSTLLSAFVIDGKAYFANFDGVRSVNSRAVLCAWGFE